MSNTNSDYNLTDDQLRQSVRLPKSYTVDVKALTFPLSNTFDFSSQSSDISVDGICIEAFKPYECGAKMQVRVKIPLLNMYASTFLKVYENDAEQYFSAIAEVVWCRPQGSNFLIGMRFINTDETDVAALAELIRKVTAANEKADA